MRRASLKAATIAALMFAFHVGVDTRPVGKGEDPFLAMFGAALDDHGIDFVPGDARDVDFKTELRPRLAKLRGFPMISSVESRSPERWQNEFARGAFNYLVAYQRPSDADRSSTEAPSDTNTFLARWAEAPGRRIFVAFTREDSGVAEKVALVLRAQGLVVFTFLRGGEPTPWADPAIVGRLFQEADHHLVIDTPAARQSGGVAFEALALTRLKYVTKRATAGSGGCAEWLGLKP
jgi:hypothetical protein